VRGEAAVVGGHTHQLVTGEVDGVPLVEAGSNGRWLGRITLSVERATRTVLRSSSEIVPVYADDRAPDPRLAELVAQHRAELAPRLDRVLGEAGQEILAAREECGMGNLVADAMRAAVGADVALQNPGGVRAPFDVGPITYGEVWRVMPFDNTIVVFELDGAELRALLEESAADGGFLHLSGLEAELDFARAPGERVVRLARAGGAALEPDARLAVAVNSFMAEGGDGLASLVARDGRDDGRLLREALAEYVAAFGAPLAHGAEGRLVLRGR
jgi:5'-nucleotidase